MKIFMTLLFRSMNEPIPHLIGTRSMGARVRFHLTYDIVVPTVSSVYVAEVSKA